MTSPPTRSSPPAACSTIASGFVQAFAKTNTTFSFVPVYKEVLGDYCDGTPTTDSVTKYASVAANAFASAVAKAMYHVSIYACSCKPTCRDYTTRTGCNAAHVSIYAAIQAVARAQAIALADALAQVTDKCFSKSPDSEQLLALAVSTADVSALQICTDRGWHETVRC